MKKKITDAHLAEAATRHFYGETLSSIAASLGIPENSLISAKHRRSGEWRQAIGTAKRAIAEEPITELKRENTALKSENAELKSRNATLETESKAMQAEIEAVKAENENLKARQDIAFPRSFFKTA